MRKDSQMDQKKGFIYGMIMDGRGGAHDIETALAEVGLTKAGLSFDYGDMSNYGGDKFVLPLFYTLHSSPFKLETYANSFRNNLLGRCASAAVLSRPSVWRMASCSSRCRLVGTSSIRAHAGIHRTS